MIHLPTEVLEIKRGYAHCALENTDMTSWLEVVEEDGRGYIKVKIDDQNSSWLKANS